MELFINGRGAELPTLKVAFKRGSLKFGGRVPGNSAKTPIYQILFLVRVNPSKNSDFQILWMKPTVPSPIGRTRGPGGAGETTVEGAEGEKSELGMVVIRGNSVQNVEVNSAV